MKRIWVYARRPFSAEETQEQLNDLLNSAKERGWCVTGYSSDIAIKRHKRPGYKEMMSHVRQKDVDLIYIPSMSEISHRDRCLFRFFEQLLRYGVGVVAMEYDLRYVVNRYTVERKIEQRAKRMGVPAPWNCFSEGTEGVCSANSQQA